MKIPIKKHTPVRHPKSRYKLFLEDTGGSISFRNGTSVNDITRKHQTVSKVPKYDWTDMYTGKIGRNTTFKTPIKSLADHLSKPKETLWQRIKRYYKEGLTE